MWAGCLTVLSELASHPLMFETIERTTIILPPAGTNHDIFLALSLAR